MTPRPRATSVPASASTPSTSSSRRASACRPSSTWRRTRRWSPPRWRQRAAPKRRRAYARTLARRPSVARCTVPRLRRPPPRLGSAPVVLVVAAPPRVGGFEPLLVPPPRGEVEEVVGPHQSLDATGVGGVRVVNGAVLEREDTHALPLRLGLVDVPVVVIGAVSTLLLGEGDPEVVVEVAPERGNPRESPAHLPLVALEVLQRGDRRTNESDVVAVQVGNDGVEVIGDEGASGTSPALGGQPESVAEHEVIDQQLRAPAEEVRQRGAAFVGLESVLLVDPNPRQPLP